MIDIKVSVDTPPENRGALELWDYLVPESLGTDHIEELANHLTKAIDQFMQDKTGHSGLYRDGFTITFRPWSTQFGELVHMLEARENL